jgi:beta-galactosidase
MLRGTEAPPDAIWIDSLDLSKMVRRRQRPRAGRSLAGGSQGALMTLGGVRYAHGIGTLSINELIIDLKGQATRFLAMVGLNDNASKQGSVTVEVWLDNKKVLISDVLRAGSPPLKVDVDLTGARFLELTIDDGNDVSTETTRTGPAA